MGEGGGRAPSYLWPLGNTTVHHEVMHGHDAHLPDASQCFVFQTGYPGLPYDAITLGSPGAFVDFHFAGEVNFQVPDKLLLCTLCAWLGFGQRAFCKVQCERLCKLTIDTSLKRLCRFVA